MDNKIFWQRTLALMKSQFVTREQLAKDLNIPFTTLQGWISKKRLPAADIVCNMAVYLKTTAEYLCLGIEPGTEDKTSELIRKVADVLRSYQ